jgi:hypothetical protein
MAAAQKNRFALRFYRFAKKIGLDERSGNSRTSRQPKNRLQFFQELLGSVYVLGCSS